MLKVDRFSLVIENKQVVDNISFSLKPGTITVCMGPNGSGKSSLVNALAGHPKYKVTAGSIFVDDKDITQLTPDKRARLGLFLSVQNPLALPGVTVKNLLKESFRALNKDADIKVFDARLLNAVAVLDLDESFLTRSVNDGFSGGEKKRSEMLQLLVLQPKVILLDEIDSGLDVDALKSVGNALNWFMEKCPESSLFIITHYHNILEYVKPDQVLIMHNGALVKKGNAALATEIAKDGYDQFSKS